MTTYTADALAPEYRQLWQTMTYLPGAERAAQKVAGRLLSNLDRYLALQALVNVPAAFIMCVHERESSGDFSTYLGNGQPLNRVTTIVPAGRGPFASFEAGAVDAFKLEKLGGIAITAWDEAMLCWWAESFNGFGYRNHGVRSPYLWGQTNHQQPGKYVADNVFDPSFVDPQLGVMAVYGAIIEAHPELDLGGPAGGPLLVPVAARLAAVSFPRQPVPDAIRSLQASLNYCGATPPIGVDGSSGPETRGAYDALRPLL